MKPTLFALPVLCALIPLHAVSAAEMVMWPNPWEAGRTLVYETENLDSDTAPGSRKKVRMADTTEIRIIEASLDGFVQQWVSSGTQMEVLEGDKAEAEAIFAAMKSFEGFPLLVELDKEANYRRIRNLDEISERMRTALRPLFVAGVEAGVKKSLGEQADEETAKQVLAAAMTQVDGTLEKMTSAPMIDAMLGRLIQSYNAFVGVELEDGEWYSLETELDNPLGGKKFPATLKFGLYPSKQDPADVFIEWESAIDPKKGLDVIWGLVENLYGMKVSKADRKKLPKQISLVDEGFMVFNRESGVIEMFESTRTVKLGDKLNVDRNRMRLTNGEHEHTWTGESDTAEAVASP